MRFFILFFLFSMSSAAFCADEGKYDDFIFTAAHETGVSPHLIKAIIKQESHFRDDIGNGSVVSSAGAIGAMQLMPGTAEQMGYTPEQMKDPETNIMAGAKYIKYLIGKDYIGNNPLLIMAAYNAGPGNVKDYNGVPPFNETVNYVNKAAQFYAAYAGIPPIDTSSVPPPSVGTIPDGGKGTLPISFVNPSISSNSAEVLSKFESSIGISAAVLSGLLKGLLGALALIFAALQLFLFWKGAVLDGDNSRKALISPLISTLRTFLVVVVLFQFVTT